MAEQTPRKQRTNGQGKARSGDRPARQDIETSGRMSRGGGGGGSALAPSTRAMRDPFSLLRSMVEDIDGVFERFGMGRMSPWSRGQGAGMVGSFTPQLEVFRRDNQLVVHTDLPGMNKDDIHIEVDDQNQQLIIRGERQQSSQWDEQGVMHTERSYGSFYRAVPLPDGIDADTCKASFDNGVLEICLDMPSAPQRSARRIDIE